MLRRGIRHLADNLVAAPCRFLGAVFFGLHSCGVYRIANEDRMPNYRLHALDGCFERVRRADEHLADLKGRLREMTRQQIDALVVNFHTEPPYGIKEVLRPKQTFFDMRIGILIGEICYNLKSALDWLIFELANLDSGTFQGGTQFPIDDTQERFAAHVKQGWLKGLNASHIAAIERLQPYNGCDWAGRLRDCTNPDKHRHFVPTGGGFAAWVYTSIESDLSRIHGETRATPHPVYGTVDMKVHFFSHVAFDGGAPVVDTLQEIKAGVADALAQFKPEF